MSQESRIPVSSSGMRTRRMTAAAAEQTEWIGVRQRESGISAMPGGFAGSGKGKQREDDPTGAASTSGVATNVGATGGSVSQESASAGALDDNEAVRNSASGGQRSRSMSLDKFRSLFSGGSYNAIHMPNDVQGSNQDTLGVGWFEPRPSRVISAAGIQPHGYKNQLSRSYDVSNTDFIDGSLDYDREDLSKFSPTKGVGKRHMQPTSQSGGLGGRIAPMTANGGKPHAEHEYMRNDLAGLSREELLTQLVKITSLLNEGQQELAESRSAEAAASATTSARSSARAESLVLKTEGKKKTKLSRTADYMRAGTEDIVDRITGRDVRAKKVPLDDAMLAHHRINPTSALGVEFARLEEDSDPSSSNSSDNDASSDNTQERERTGIKCRLPVLLDLYTWSVFIPILR